MFLEHSQTFVVGLFCKKKLTAKSFSIFLQKTSIIDFWLDFKYGSWQYCQKNNSYLRYISPVIKLFVSLFLS